MFNALGFLVTLACVFGGFVVAGGKIQVILEALPHEMLTIVGASIGAFIVANSGRIGKETLSGIAQVFKGARWKKQDYIDLLSLLYLMVGILKTKGILGLEKHIEEPASSALFQRFPRLAADHHLVDFICDYFRMLTLNMDDPHQMADIIEADIERLHQEEHAPQAAVASLADALPAIGIVAAVLGVINTMASIDQPTEILGEMIGSALVGTFLGVLLAYCFVAPLASRLGQIIAEDSTMYQVVKAALLTALHGASKQMAVEAARRTVPSWHAPTFAELEAALDELPSELSA